MRDLVFQRLGDRPTGRIGVLANVRTLGWLLNPISCYFCFDATSAEVVAMVAEVENTPWHERHAYVVGAPGTYRFPKVLHVSPFLPMDLDYELRFDAPGGEAADHVRGHARSRPGSGGLDRASPTLA